MRFDKNGIRILDPEKQVNQIVNKKCLPDEHRFKDLIEPEPGHTYRPLDTHVNKCEICGEIEVLEWDAGDGNEFGRFR